MRKGTVGIVDLRILTEPIAVVEMFALGPNSVIDIGGPSHVASDDEPSRGYFR